MRFPRLTTSPANGFAVFGVVLAALVLVEAAGTKGNSGNLAPGSAYFATASAAFSTLLTNGAMQDAAAPVAVPPASPLGARNDLPDPYLAGVSWGELPGGRHWGSTAGVFIAADGNIWAIDRCGASGSRGTNCADSPLDPILEFEPSGKFIRSFGHGMFVSPHKITVDHDGNLWVADNGVKDGKGQQVFKFDRDGKLLLTLGKAGVSGPGTDTFDQPTEVAIAPNGDIFVADGHGNAPTANARIMKFDKNGKFLKTWGKKGTGIGEFDCPHTLAFDSQGRLFVGDRQNNRIQIFDQDGHFIAEWKQFGRPSGIYIDKNDVIYVADSESREGKPGYGYNPGCRRGIRIGSAKDGSVKYFVPDAGPFPAARESTGAEGIAADADGNLYGAEFTMDVKKYARKR